MKKLILFLLIITSFSSCIIITPHRVHKIYGFDEPKKYKVYHYKPHYQRY